jgi:hypothetical protein
MPLIPSGEVPQRIAQALAVRGGLSHAGRGPSTATATNTAPETIPNGNMRGGDPACHHPPWLPGSIESVMVGRRAVHQFADDELSRQQLTAIADSAYKAEQTVWPAETHGTIRFTILAAAYRVSTLRPGLYLVDPAAADDAFQPLTAGPWLESLREVYADAACLMLVCADFSGACRTDGPGYGPLVIRAGTLGYGAWLSAVGLGLAGCVYGATHYRVTETVRQLHAQSRHMFTVAVGRPASTPTLPGNTTLGG